MTPMDIFLMVIAGLVLAAVAGLAFYLAWKGRVEGVIAVYVALLLCGHGRVPAGQLVFWGVASAVTVALMLLLPRQVSKSTVGMAYLTAGGLVGMWWGSLSAPWRRLSSDRPPAACLEPLPWGVSTRAARSISLLVSSSIMSVPRGFRWWCFFRCSA